MLVLSFAWTTVDMEVTCGFIGFTYFKEQFFRGVKTFTNIVHVFIHLFSALLHAGDGLPLSSFLPPKDVSVV